MGGSPRKRWDLLALPIGAQAFILTVDVLALGLTVGFLVGERPSLPLVLRAAVLLVVTIGYAEIAKGSERVRRYLGVSTSNPRPNPLSVWSFAALLLLPAGWAAAFVIVQHAHLWWQRRRDQSGASHRVVFTGAAAVLGQLAAAALLADHSGGSVLQANTVATVSVLAAGVAYTVIDLGVLLIGMWLATRPPSVRSMLPDLDALGFEIACLVCGLAAAEMALRTLLLVPLMAVPVMYLHRATMIKSLHRAARVDVKTGLLNAAAWYDHARAALSRSSRTQSGAALLMIDIDRFKQINDAHGHLVGDTVLSKLGGLLREELRGHDGVGRFGGDEFVVLLEDVSDVVARVIAHRVQDVLREVDIDGRPITTSVGIAHTQLHGADLTALLAAADEALYAAKSAGRSCVRVADSGSHLRPVPKQRRPAPVSATGSTRRS